MDLTPYVDNLRRELAVAAEVGGEPARELAERLTAPLDAAARLTLLAALSGAAEEITRELAPGSVDVRLRGREPEFVVSRPMAPAEPAPMPANTPSEAEDGVMTRINLRLPEHLKARIEEAAGRSGLSANAWLVRAAAAVLTENEPATGARSGGQRYTGWVS